VVLRAFGWEEILAAHEDLGLPGESSRLWGSIPTGSTLGEIPFSASASSKMFRASARFRQPSKCRRSIRKRFGRRSLTTLLDDLAGLYVLKIVLEHCFAEAQHL
jgi:hypothetical protein